MRKIVSIIAVLLLSLASTDAVAQFTSGTVYHFKNVGDANVALASASTTDVAASPVNKSSKNQLWYCESNGGYYTFRNLANGRYLSGNTASNGWGLTDTASDNTNLFESYSSEGYYSIKSKAHSTDYGSYMHKDGSNNIVGWGTYESGTVYATLWSIETSYEYTIDDAYWDEVIADTPNAELLKTYQGYLEELFTDGAGACVTPKLGELSEAKATKAYENLPTALQAMVDKVYNNAWEETNTVSSKPSWGADYAKRFRVQMYEPYSVEDEATLNYLKIYENSNMDNPTGIYANNGDLIYIMVEGEIADGAEVWLTHQNGHGATSKYNNASYTKLRSGLNAVQFNSDYCQLWVAYVVHTFNKDGATKQEKFPENRKLSNYKPLKIHVHGGHINGFYNAIGDYRATATGTPDLWGDVDNDDDYKYYTARLPLNGTDLPNRDFPILGHRITLLFEYGIVTINGAQYPSLMTVMNNVLADDYYNTYPSTPNCNNGTYGSYGTFDQYTDMELSKSNGKINIMLEAWERILYSQYATMGLLSTATMDKMNSMYPRWTANNQPAEIYNYGSATVNGETKTYKEFCQGVDYSEYFNHHATAQGTNDGNPSASYRHTNFPYHSLNEPLYEIPAKYAATWAVAHEIGHQHQGPINLQGQTENTNNFFSNVSVWYMGMATSRYSNGQGSLESLLSTFNNDTESQYKQLAGNMALSQMYYRLWLYYHLAGNNTQFWPRLFELCRQTPLADTPYGNNDGATTLLRFYKHACDAAGEDLTEFFRAHGYLDVMEGVQIGDYMGATYYQTQTQIDEAIAYVKNKKYPANYAVLLINDGTDNTTVKHDGVSKRELYDGSATAEMGSVNDFIAGNTSVTGAYEMALSGSTVTMSGGQGGVGFLVFNKKGELVSFSNKSTFTLNAEAQQLLESGEATVSVIGSNGNVIAEVSTTGSVTPAKYTITAVADPTKAGTATVNGGSSATVEANSSVELSAEAYSGYTFVNWTLNGNPVSTNQTHTVTVTGNADYVANFKENQAGEPVVTNCNIPSDNTMRYYRLAIAVAKDAYEEDFNSDYNKVQQFWQDCEDFMNEMYVPLGMCFDVVVDQKLLLDKNLPTSGDIPEISVVTEYINTAIGSSSYDIGICICYRGSNADNTGQSSNDGAYTSTTKANGYAKADKWVVAHEVGHLFGAAHTPQGENSLMDNKGEFFSYPSIKAIRTKSVNNGAGNAYKSEIVANNAPTFTSQMKETYRIPQGACLSIPVYANDTDGHSLRYTAMGCSSSTVDQYNGGEELPHFAAFKPQTSNLIEYSPKYTEDTNGDYRSVEGTDIPSMDAGTYSIAILVNDMPAANSYDYLTSNPFYSNYAVWDANVEIVGGTQFTASLSPSQNSYTAGQTVTVSWGVNNNYFTEDSHVRITMSTDYGKTFNYVLADDVPALDGSKTVILPNVNVGNVDVDFSTKYVSAVRSMRAGIIRVEEVDGIAYTLTTTTPNNGGGFTVTGGGSEPVTYTISVVSGEGGSASIDGKSSATVTAGSSVTLAATPDNGYRFDGWYLNSSCVSDETSYTITATASVTYNAVFVEEAGAPVTYTISVTEDPEYGGTATVATGTNPGKESIEVEANGEVVLDAKPANGYTFVEWTLNGVHITSEATYLVTATGDASYVAKFKQDGSGSDPEPSTGLGGKWYRIKDNGSGKYIDINKNGTTDNAHGNVIMSDKDENSERQIIYFETSGDGYKLKAATGDYIKCEQWNVSAGDANSAATLIFEETGDLYYIKWNHTSYQNNIYYFKVENAKGGDYALHPYDDAASTSIAAKWKLEEVKYTISVSASEGGTAEVATGGGGGAASVEVPYDGSATLTATPASGYSFVNWTKDGTPVSEDAEFTINNVKADAQYVANFKEESAGTPDFNDKWFRVKSAGNCINIENNDEHTGGAKGGVNMAEYSQNNGAQIFKFEKSGDGYKLKSLSGYYIKCQSWNVDANSNEVTEATVLQFETISEGLYYIKNTNGYFKTEKANIDDYGNKDENSPDYIYCDAASKAAATWTLEEVTLHDVAVTADPADAGTATAAVATGTTTDKVEQGTSVTLTANANSGYSFTGWYNGETLISSNNPYTFIANSATTLTAKFEQQVVKYTISVSFGDGGWAYIGGGVGTDVNTEAASGDKVTLCAEASDGYEFVNWTLDGEVVSTDANYTITVSGDAKYVANFKEQGAGTPEPEFPSELDGRWFRLKKKDTELYMNILNNYDNSGAASGITVAAKADNDEESDKQIFEFQKSDDNYKLKSKGLYYIGINGVNVNASSMKEGAELTLEYAGEVNEYRIMYKEDYFNTQDVNDGTYLFCKGNEGTIWVLEEVEDYNFSDSYKALRDKYNEYGYGINPGSEVGDYTEECADEFNAALSKAKEMLSAANSTDDEYDTALEDLTKAAGNLSWKIVLPEETKYYVIRSAKTGLENNRIYAGSSTVPALHYDNAAICSKHVFTLELSQYGDTYLLKSLERGTYLSSAETDGSTQYKISSEDPTPVDVKIARLSRGSRAVSIKPYQGGYMLNAGPDNKVVGYDNSDATSGSAWYIDEVSLNDIYFDVTMKAKFSSVTLGYNATVPAGVEAYNAEGIDGGYVSLVETAKEGEVIPANTPVILYRTDSENGAKTFRFTYTDETADKPASTVLGGSLYTKYIECDDADYYKLMIKNNEAKMYLMYKEFDAEGNSKGESHDGGHIKCSANKIYMRVPGGNQMAMFGMRFVKPGATEIENVEIGNEKEEIFDLSGRKLTEITEPGFYIVNGKRVFIK